ncbi:MAG: hypothetical protein K2X47_08315, partial [Bdellovibrionales bacterium]|nr:hypothetical protein [Bdellovibrionales bacterium]
IDLDRKVFQSLEGMPTINLLFEKFKQSSILSKEHVFTILNLGEEFNKLTHDGAVRSLIARFRKVTGLALQTENASVRLVEPPIFIR